MHGNGSVQGSRPFIDRHRSLAAGRQASAAAIVDNSKSRGRRRSFRVFEDIILSRSYSRSQTAGAGRKLAAKIMKLPSLLLLPLLLLLQLQQKHMKLQTLFRPVFTIKHSIKLQK